MSRFNNNRGGLGMNNFQPRRGGGPGGPMRGGLMGNPNFRNHPFQNQNQNRRGPNNNFNRPPNQGPQTPQKPQHNQMPIIPPPSPGPALTMKGPMQQQQKPAQPQQEQEQRKPTTPAAQPKTPPPQKPNMTSPPPNQANKSQNESHQLKSPMGNANGQQQKQPPQASPKPGPQQGQKPGPQQGQRTGPPNRSGQVTPKQEPEKKATDSRAAESDGSQPKVCFIFCN